jgi:23S rRNA-/tRNA-specific pseudouridylate synthase
MHFHCSRPKLSSHYSKSILAFGIKPIRLEVKNLTSTLQEGDYLRVHHMPRRFPEVHIFDWSKGVNEPTSSGELPGVIVSENAEIGYIILNKPAGVPVHPTVDNDLENVAGSIGRALVKTRRNELEAFIMEAQQKENSTYTNHLNETVSRRNWKQKEETPLYVVTPQRLDQNTSGLFVVATKKVFASYFAKLLRSKTDAHLSPESFGAARASMGQIQKQYRCLVCIQPSRQDSEAGE